MELLVVRHGETVANVEHIYQGQTQGELNERGIAQANELRESLQGREIDIIFSSDLKRAKDSAKIIAKGRDVEIIYDKRLRERFLGELQGKPIDDNTKFCDIMDSSERDQAINPMGIEPLNEMFARVHYFIDDISKLSKDKGYKKILVVSHGITINIFKAISLGEGVEELKGYSTAKNCSLQVMQFNSHNL